MKESTAQLPWQENSDMPAFPVCEISDGLTKREQFAMAAMQGILSNPAHNTHGFMALTEVSKVAIQHSDELLKQLSDGE